MDARSAERGGGLPSTWQRLTGFNCRSGRGAGCCDYLPLSDSNGLGERLSRIPSIHPSIHPEDVGGKGQAWLCAPFTPSTTGELNRGLRLVHGCCQPNHFLAPLWAFTMELYMIYQQLQP